MASDHGNDDDDGRSETELVGIYVVGTAVAVDELRERIEDTLERLDTDSRPPETKPDRRQGDDDRRGGGRSGGAQRDEGVSAVRWIGVVGALVTGAVTTTGFVTKLLTPDGIVFVASLLGQQFDALLQIVGIRTAFRVTMFTTVLSVFAALYRLKGSLL